MEGRETKNELIIMLLVFIIGLIYVLSFLKEGTLQGVLALSLSIGILNILLNIAFPDKAPEKPIIFTNDRLDLGEWIKFDWENKKTRPTKYGKYLVCRKDGKIHFEIWNGNGFAYNTEVIEYWCKIKPPFITPQNETFL